MPADVPLRYAVSGVGCVAVDPPPSAVGEFLEGYLRPFFPDKPAPDWRLSWRVVPPDELDALVRSRSGEAAERGVVRDGGSWFAWHRDDPADTWTCELLDEPARTLHLLVAEVTEVGRYVLARAVRSLLATLACSAGWVQVHASAFCFADGAVLVVGNKRVGKTSMLLTSLTRGARFLSNDRVLLKSEDGVVTARGLPHSVTVRAGTGAAQVMRGARSTYGDRQPGNATQDRYNVADVLVATGTTVTASARLGLVVAPAVVKAGVHVARVAPEEAEGLLRAERRRSTSSFDPLWDAWRPQPDTPIAWPDAVGVRVGYGPSEVVPAVDAIREELHRAG